MLHLLLNHGDRLRPALMGADAAAFAVIEIRLKKPLGGLRNAAFRAKHITDPALDTLLVFPDGTLGPPTARLISTGAARGKNHAARGYFMPCFRPFLLFHGNTSIIFYFAILTLS
jgi:hypothetical protein